MSEFFLCEIENIEKSGVEIKVTGTRLKKDDDDCIRTVRAVCFDFSEHDKVFEDKIAELKKDYKTVSGLLSDYQQENESLKQRIAELESKETENTVEVRVLASPIEIATHLINNTCTINELKMIAEHINVYCNGGK